MPETTPETMPSLEDLRQSLPEPAKDLKLNLQSVLKPDQLNEAQTWGVALTCAYFLKDAPLARAVRDQAVETHVGEEVIDDAKAAAAIMAMNTVYYRFRHVVGKETYSHKPARLRMNRMMKPATNKTDFELFSLAAAALAGCEMCIRTHEATLVKQEVTEDAINDAIRIAATLSGVSMGLTLA